jgi:hypothetical protein
MTEVVDRFCPRCETTKALDAFTLRKSGPRVGQAVAHCKECSVKAHKARSERDTTLYRRVEWPSKIRRLYGITPSDYFAMLEAQNGCCATCGAATPGTRNYKRMGKAEAFYIDHCHATGRVRGLLCLNCNTAIGLIRDNPTVAQNISAYLRKGK